MVSSGSPQILACMRSVGVWHSVTHTFNYVCYFTAAVPDDIQNNEAQVELESQVMYGLTTEHEDDWMNNKDSYYGSLGLEC